VPHDQTAGQRKADDPQRPADRARDGGRPDAEERREEEGEQRREVDGGGSAREIRVYKTGAVAEGPGQPRVDAVVVEDADEKVIPGEDAARQGGEECGGAGTACDAARVGQGDRQFPPGGSRLYRRIWKKAAIPSRQVIFFPSA